MQGELEAAARALARASMVVALTGAGISIDSGIPAFRGSQGLWDRYDPMDYATIEALTAKPRQVWEMLLELEGLMHKAEPNAAHEALAELESMKSLHLVVTQNIDGLHQAAGSSKVVELHGSGKRLVCLDCGMGHGRSVIDPANLPPRCACGGLIKPDVVFFGEALPEKALRRAMNAASHCSVMLVVGTSAVVAPASHLPLVAKQSGATIIEVNPEPTGLTDSVTDYFLQDGAAHALPRLVQALRSL